MTSAGGGAGDGLTGEDRDLRLGGVLRREGNWKCFLLTLMIGGCLASVAWCTLAQVDREIIDLSAYPIKRTVRESPCEVGYAYIPIAFVLLLYLVYLVECYHSTARIQLARRTGVAGVAARVRAMRDAPPRVWWKAICYHYVRRKRQVTRYRNGDAYTTTQVYYERVNTHSASTSFAHACCGQRDASRNLRLEAGAGAGAGTRADAAAAGRGRPPITKVRFSKGFAFANIEAASEFEEQRSRFFAEHERFDDFMEMREGLDLVGVSAFKEYMVAYRDTERTPWYASQALFWALSCLLLSWPLRIAIECNTAYVHYTITKIFGTNYELDPSRHLDLETHLSEHTPPVTASNYGWASPALLAEQSAVMVTASASASSSSAGSGRQVDILALAAKRPDPAALSHATTIDSLELFAAIRENCALVPSYSEALRIESLLERDAPHQTHDLRSALRRTTVKAASFDEPTRRPRVPIAGTHSNLNLVGNAGGNGSAKAVNRRSWAGMVSSGRQVVEDIRTYAAGSVAYRPISETRAPRTPAGERARELFYPRSLSPRCARDPFGGRAQTTPTDEPPPYEEALRLPAVRRLTRSATGELAAPAGRRAYLLDTLANRRSCVLSDARGVRLLHSDPLYETAM